MKIRDCDKNGYPSWALDVLEELGGQSSNIAHKNVEDSLLDAVKGCEALENEYPKLRAFLINLMKHSVWMGKELDKLEHRKPIRNDKALFMKREPFITQHLKEWTESEKAKRTLEAYKLVSDFSKRIEDGLEEANIEGAILETKSFHSRHKVKLNKKDARTIAISTLYRDVEPNYYIALNFIALKDKARNPKLKIEDINPPKNFFKYLAEHKNLHGKELSDKGRNEWIAKAGAMPDPTTPQKYIVGSSPNYMAKDLYEANRPVKVYFK